MISFHVRNTDTTDIDDSYYSHDKIDITVSRGTGIVCMVAETTEGGSVTVDLCYRADELRRIANALNEAAVRAEDWDRGHNPGSTRMAEIETELPEFDPSL